MLGAKKTETSDMRRSLAISLTLLAACTAVHTQPDAPTAPEPLDAGIDASPGAAPDAPLVERDVPCPPGFAMCEGACVLASESEAYCGADPSCERFTRCLDGEICVGGACTIECAPGLTNCDGSCVDPSTDRDHCGASPDTCSGGAVCDTTEYCVGGRCVGDCEPGLLRCFGRCIDPLSDREHCGLGADCTGGVGPCTGGLFCLAGRCIDACPAGEYLCGGRCIDPGSDAEYCGASATCSDGVACGPREECTRGACGCVAPERDCGGLCVDVRYDASSCGACGRTCAATERCLDGDCRVDGGLTGGFGSAWESFAFVEVLALQEYLPRSGTDLYAGAGARFGAWETGALRFRDATAPPVAIARHTSLAYYGGGIFQVASTDLGFYQPPTDEWRTVALGSDLGEVGMTITAEDSLYTVTPRFLHRASPATSATAPIPVPTRLTAPRLTFEALSQRVIFASQGERELRSYDPVAGTFRVESLAPGPIGAAFCGDRAGHVYVGSEAEPRRLWQYTPASASWRELPLLPASVTGTTNCGVAEAGALYVASAPGAELHRLVLDRR